MDTSRQEYPALLTVLQPSQAAAVLNDRIRLINKINADVADWLQERRRVEEVYVQGLRKLARRPQLDGGAALGVFQIPWQRIVSATESLAASHEAFATKIESDVERPLKEYASKNPDLSTLPSIHNDLLSLSKTLDAAQKKADKAKDKKAKGADKAKLSLSEAARQWEARAPSAFEQLQAADENRLIHLRDVLTQFQTHEVDQIERAREIAESCLNVLLNVETADEIKTFAAKISGGRDEAARRPSSSATAAAATTVDVPAPTRTQDETASQHSNQSGRAAGQSPPVSEPKPTPRMGGLRRLGTVMNRRKSMAFSPNFSSPGSEKKSRSPFAFRKSESKDHTPLPSTPPNNETPDTAESVATPASSHPTRNGQRVSEDPDAITPIPEDSVAPTTNGATAHASAPSAPSEPEPAKPRVDSEGYSERPALDDEITRAQREAAGAEDTGLQLTIRDKPIQEDEGEAKQALDDTANALRLQGLQSGIRRNAGTIRGRRDVRNTVFVPTPTTADSGPTGSSLSLEAPTPSPGVPSPGAPPRSAGHPPLPTGADERATSDTTSVHSSHTLHSISGPVIHPELHEPGLNASIIETVNSWFAEGAVTKSFVVGELALAYNGSVEAQQTSTVRLDNFPILEKVAANPHFVTDIASKTDDDKCGEYTVALSSINRPAPTVAFKYQIHLPPEDQSRYSPIILKPAWNIQEFQASVIIAYSLNESFISSTPLESIVLKNVLITVGLDLSPEEDPTTKQPREVARATGAMMYPNTGASFRRKQSAVVWKLPELEIKAGADNKFLARFTTTTSWPRRGKVEARFEYQTADAALRLGISTASSSPSSAGTLEESTNPFADETPASPGKEKTWTPVPTVRKLVSGKYTAS